MGERPAGGEDCKASPCPITQLTRHLAHRTCSPLKALHRDRAARSPVAPDPLVVRRSAAVAAAAATLPNACLPCRSAPCLSACSLLTLLTPFTTQDEVADRLLDRLEDCRRTFERAVVLGGAGAAVAARLASGRAGVQVLEAGW